MTEFFWKMTRLKDPRSNVLRTNLRRCLSTMDIALLGIGHMIGQGIYVIAPGLAHRYAGPALVVSFCIAGVTALFAALAYAELGVRYPRAGSAYSYAYFTVGELLAFFVGWNVLMETVLTIAAISRACSEYADSLADGTFSNFTIGIMGSLKNDSDGLVGSYPNILAALILLAFLGFMALGAKETSWLNNILVYLNLVVLSLVVAVGVWFADFSNWTSKEGDPEPDGFLNGFLPFGWAGVFAAASQCFCSFIGFDGIACAGEEAINPKEAIPVATFLAMGLATFIYVSVSSVLTLMMPYYEINSTSAIPDALGRHHVEWATAIVSIGAMICMGTATIGALYSVSRTMFAMAEDGLLPSILQQTFRQVPIVSMVMCTVCAASAAVFFNIAVLVELLSIGSLFAYLVVAFAVLVDRHTNAADFKGVRPAEGTALSLKLWARRLRGLYPSNVRQRDLVICVLTLVTALSFGAGFTLNSCLRAPLRFAIGGTFGILILACVLYLTPLSEPRKDSNYKMPLTPFLPIISIFCDAFLMTALQTAAWERLAGWMAFGFLLYLVHGMHHSKLASRPVS